MAKIKTKKMRRKEDWHEKVKGDLKFWCRKFNKVITTPKKRLKMETEVLIPISIHGVPRNARYDCVLFDMIKVEWKEKGKTIAETVPLPTAVFEIESSGDRRKLTTTLEKLLFLPIAEPGRVRAKERRKYGISEKLDAFMLMGRFLIVPDFETKWRAMNVLMKYVIPDVSYEIKSRGRVRRHEKIFGKNNIFILTRDELNEFMPGIFYMFV